MSESLNITEQISIAATAADKLGAVEQLALDVSNPLPFVDAFLIATGRNERNVLAIAREIEDALNLAGVKTKRREGRDQGRWVLVDFGGLVVHVFHEEERHFYDLERLWKDCPVLPLGLPETVAAGE